MTAQEEEEERKRQIAMLLDAFPASQYAKDVADIEPFGKEVKTEPFVLVSTDRSKTD
jgi:5-formyltetrahydrofolate cyclo-ligase